MRESKYSYKGVRVACRACMLKAIEEKYGKGAVGWQGSEWMNDNNCKGIFTEAPCEVCNK
jgi:hypothetical protein